MTDIAGIAMKFFEACEAGKGWEACKAFCEPKASFTCQSGPLLETKTLHDYAEWMKGLLVTMPDGKYKVLSFATDATRNNVCAYGKFSGTHTGPGGPVPPTRKTLKGSDYVYVMEFAGDKISHMTKIWADGWAMQQLGWG